MLFSHPRTHEQRKTENLDKRPSCKQDSLVRFEFPQRVEALTCRVLLQELAHGLGELLSYEGNVEEDFYLTFQVSTRTEKRPHGAINPSVRRISTMFCLMWNMQFYKIWKQMDLTYRFLLRCARPEHGCKQSDCSVTKLLCCEIERNQPMDEMLQVRRIM